MGQLCFSSLNLQSGYHQAQIADAEIPKTAFQTHEGLIEFKVLSFGLTNAPGVCKHKMNKMSGQLSFVLVYLDDFIVFSKSPDEHVQDLRQVLDVLHCEKLPAKTSKCFLYRESVEFLGHVVSAQGVWVDPKKSGNYSELAAAQKCA